MTASGRFFSNERRAWAAVVLYTALLYSTLTLVYDVYMPINRVIGPDSMSWWVNALFLVAGAVVLFCTIRRFAPRAGAWIALVLIGSAASYTLWQLELPAKRIHFFQYAPLTLLVLEAVSFRSHDRYRYIWTLALVTLIGLGDETLQGLLPKRFFGLTDVMVNSLAGLLTLGFVAFVIGDEGDAPPAKTSLRGEHR